MGSLPEVLGVPWDPTCLEGRESSGFFFLAVEIDYCGNAKDPAHAHAHAQEGVQMGN